jgi:hypothetical protein
LDSKLKFSNGADTLAESGGRALSTLIAKLRTMKGVGVKTFFNLYNAYVTPIVDYGSEIWGYIKADKANNVHNKAIRYFLGVNKFAPKVAIQAEVGWMTPKYRRIQRMLSFWNRLIQMDNNRLTKKLFNYDYNLRENNWSAEMEQIFNFIGYPSHFDDLTCCDITLCTNKLKNRLYQEWENTILEKPKLRTYRLFKVIDENECYINCFMTKRRRSLLAKIRVGILPIEIEVGRYKKKLNTDNNKYESIKENERLCRLCDTDEVENETHFVCICPKYDVLRQQLFNLAIQLNVSFNELSVIEKFVYLMRFCQKGVAEFVEKAWMLRNQEL